LLTQMLEETAEGLPEQVALVYGDERIRYGELALQVRRLAGGLQALGVGPADAVAIVLPNVPELVTSFFAVAGLGAVVVPLNPQFKEAELDYTFRDCRVRAVITNEQHAPTCREILSRGDASVPLITPGGSAPHGTAFGDLLASPPVALPARAPDQDGVYQYSSGSTGRPKRVPRTHGQCCAEADQLTATTELSPLDTIFCAVPLFHTYGLANCMLAAARRGASLVLFEPGGPFMLFRDSALQTLERERVSVFPGVPFVFRHLVDSPKNASLSALRLCYSAGTALPRATFDAFLEKFGVPIRQLYGCTEAGSVALNLDPDPASTAASVGRPIGAVAVEIVDEGGRPLPAGQIGEVTIRSPSLTRGYAEMDELNRQAFRNGSFFTGDLGRLDAEGRLTLTGRKKLFIEVVGNKVDPFEVEDVLHEHPKIREAVVVGVEGAVEGEERVKAVVVRQAPCEAEEVIRFCKRRLAAYKVPATVEFRDEIPKSPLGKVLRKYLV
jgi:long-chain acyl-CoA synthetase